MVYILLGTGFEEVEAIAPCDILRRGGVEVAFAGIGGLLVAGSHGIAVKADVTVEDIDREKLDMIVLPGGLGGVSSMEKSAAARDVIRWAWDNGKLVAAICAAPTLLSQLGITEGKRCVCYPGLEHEMGSAKMEDAATVQDGPLLPGRGPGAAVDYGLMLLKVLRGEQTARQVQTGMVYHNA